MKSEISSCERVAYNTVVGRRPARNLHKSTNFLTFPASSFLDIFQFEKWENLCVLVGTMD